MLDEQTFTKLSQMKLHGLAHALQHQLESKTFDKLSFEGSFGHDAGIGDVRGMTGRISIALFFGGGGQSRSGPATRFPGGR